MRLSVRGREAVILTVSALLALHDKIQGDSFEKGLFTFGFLAIKVLKTVAIITVMGPVGPVICEGVPPKRAAKKPTKMAP